jgi:hypothetical protein
VAGSKISPPRRKLRRILLRSKPLEFAGHLWWGEGPEKPRRVRKGEGLSEGTVCHTNPRADLSDVAFAAESIASCFGRRSRSRVPALHHGSARLGPSDVHGLAKTDRLAKASWSFGSLAPPKVSAKILVSASRLVITGLPKEITDPPSQPTLSLPH